MTIIKKEKSPDLNRWTVFEWFPNNAYFPHQMIKLNVATLSAIPGYGQLDSNHRHGQRQAFVGYLAHYSVKWQQYLTTYFRLASKKMFHNKIIAQKAHFGAISLRSSHLRWWSYPFYRYFAKNHSDPYIWTI